MIFREEHIPLILDGTKTMTRRRHKRKLKEGRVYRVKKNWYEHRDIWIKITKVYKQRLGDITEEDARKEGGYTLEEFKKVWKRINCKWDPEETVTVYEFEVAAEPARAQRERGVGGIGNCFLVSVPSPRIQIMHLHRTYTIREDPKIRARVCNHGSIGGKDKNPYPCARATEYQEHGTQTK